MIGGWGGSCLVIGQGRVDGDCGGWTVIRGNGWWVVGGGQWVGGSG